MKFLLNANDDWQEGFRRFWYPRLHTSLTGLGKRVGVPMYAVGHVGLNQYVGHFDEDEETIEEELVTAGAERNPLAALKSLPDGRLSEGSWRFLHHSDPTGLVEPGVQLHLTLFERDDDLPGRELYAHYEDDWLHDPTGHLQGSGFSAKTGVSIATALIDDHTYLINHRR